MYQRLEWAAAERAVYEYNEIMLPSIFVLQQHRQHLKQVVEAVGFQGEYESVDL